MVQVAAIDAVWGGVSSTPAEDWQRVFGVNVVGTLRLCGAVVPALERRGGGSLVLISSQSALFATDTPMLAYAASKGALHSAMNQMVAELGPRKIRVNTVVPTWMWGPPVQGYCQQQAKQRGISPEAVRAELAARFPLREIPADDDVAELAVFLCSDRARMLSGQLIQVDAGESRV